MQTVEQTGAVGASDYERERGKPRPNLSHGAIQLRLGAALLARASDHYLVVSELTLEFADGVSLTPDLAVLPARPISWGLEPSKCRDVPLFVVEIDSPTQGYLEVMRKREAYSAHGVGSLWVVQPASQSIDVYLPGQPRPQIIQHGEVKDSSTGLAARLDQIFA